MSGEDRNCGPKTAYQGAGGRFRPGNPGRPKGSRHRVTLAAMSLLEGQAEALTQKAVDAALKGDMTALRLCLERIIAPVREAPARLKLPALRTAGDVARATQAVVQAAADGTLATDTAQRLAGVLDVHRKAIETSDLERRLAALEAGR